MGEISENVEKVEQKQAEVEQVKVEAPIAEQNVTNGVTIALKKMNPSSAWSNPPPPGIDIDEESKHSAVSSTRSLTGSDRIIDAIDPFIKNPEYIKYKKSLSRERHYKRSRSRSRSRDKKKRYRSRSRSRGRRRRSRSRSRGRRHRRYSHSSSRSRSSSYERRHRHKKRRSRKHSRSTSRSRKHRSDRRSRRGSRSRSHTPSHEAYVDNDQIEDKIEDDEPDVSKENAFKNDGSFLEMFKKMQEEKAKQEAEKVASASEPKRPALPPFGKRRGGRVLKTGMVEKTKAVEEEEVTNSQDAWSIYLKEVKKYKEACCDDDSKTRPLVK